MTKRTLTYHSPFLQLECTPDESVVVAAMPSGREKTLVTEGVDAQGRTPVFGVVRDNEIASLLDQNGEEIGAPVTELFGTSDYASNRSAIQGMLDSGQAVRLAGYTPINETLMVGNNSHVDIASSAELRLVGGKSRPLFKTGNAAFSGTQVLAGVYPITADHGAVGGTGTLSYVHATTSLKYAAPGDVVGSAVSIAAAQSVTAKYRVVSNNGQAIYVSLAKSFLPTSDKNQSVFVSGVTGANPVTWSVTSNLCTVTEVGHGRRVNDMVELLPGSGAARGVYAIITSTADTYTVAKTLADSTGTGYAFGARNIDLSGGGLVNMDCYANATYIDDVNGTMAVVLNMVSNVQNCTWRVANARKYAWYFTAIANSEIHPGELSTPSDGPHINGPALNVSVFNVRGRTGDNMFAIGATDYPSYLINWPDTDGTSTNGITVHGLAPQDAMEAFRIYGNSSNTFKNTLITDCVGYASESASQFASIIDDTNIYLGTGGNIDGLIVKNFCSDFGNNTKERSVFISMTGSLRGLMFDNVSFVQPATAVGVFRIAAGVVVDDLTISNLRTPSNFDGIVLETFGTGTINKLLFINPEMRNQSSTGNPVLVQTSATGTIKHLELSNVRVLNAVGPNTRLVRNYGTMQSFSVCQGRFEGLNAVFRNESGAAAGLKTSFSDLHFQSSCSFVMNTDVAADVNFSNLSGAVTRLHNNGAASGSIKLRAVNIGSLSASSHIQNPSTVTWDVHGPEIRVDVSTISRTDGSIVYNTNAALGTLGAAGLVSCQGSAANSWRLLGDPTKQY